MKTETKSGIARAVAGGMPVSATTRLSAGDVARLSFPAREGVAASRAARAKADRQHLANVAALGCLRTNS